METGEEGKSVYALQVELCREMREGREQRREFDCDRYVQRAFYISTISSIRRSTSAPLVSGSLAA